MHGTTECNSQSLKIIVPHLYSFIKFKSHFIMSTTIVQKTYDIEIFYMPKIVEQTNVILSQNLNIPFFIFYFFDTRKKHVQENYKK